MQINIEMIISVVLMIIVTVIAVIEYCKKIQAINVLEIFIETIEEIHRILGKDAQKRIKNSVRHKSLVYGIEKQVHQAIKTIEKKKNKRRE